MAWSANLTYGFATTDPALAGTPITGTMERLRDGPPYELAVAGQSTRQRTSLQWRGEPRPDQTGRAPTPAGIRGQRIVDLVQREAPGASFIGELVDGKPARVWEYTSDGGSSHWRGNELALWATDEIAVQSARGPRPRPAGDDVQCLARWRGWHIAWSALSPSILGTYRAL